MIQTLTFIIVFLLPIAACGGLAFKWAMDAHADYYRYEHHIQQQLEIELTDHDWTTDR